MIPAALLKLIPFRDYAYAALAIAAVVWFLHHDSVERSLGATRVTTAVATATAKANAAAQSKIDQLTATHADDVAKIEDNYESTIRDNDASHASDLQRLRERASRSSNSGQVLGSARGGETAVTPGAGGAVSLGSVPADIALQLVDALRADDASLMKCYADRDDLTGK